jgi:hypothetical protein
MFTCIEKRLGALALYLQSPIFEGLEKRDPNNAIIAIPGWLRLLYELLFLL